MRETNSSVRALPGPVPQCSRHEGEEQINPIFDFKGQVALVTGAGSGMKLAAAMVFAEAGAAIVLGDVSGNTSNPERIREVPIFGWRKLRDFSGTVSQMAQLSVSTPVLAASVATFMELPAAFAVAAGVFTRPSALLLFLYTLGTALIGHRYWTMTGAKRSRP